MDTIGKRLKQFREGKKLTQDEMAEASKLSQANITQWEKDRNKPSGDKLLKLLKAFPDLDSDWLMNGGKEPIKGKSVIGNKEYEHVLKENAELRKEVSDLQKKLIEVLLNPKK